MKKCECGGKIVESMEHLVLSDGYEVPLYKCKACEKEYKQREVANGVRE